MANVIITLADWVVVAEHGIPGVPVRCRQVHGKGGDAFAWGSVAMRPSRAEQPGWLAGCCCCVQSRAGHRTIYRPNPSPDSSYLATRPEATDTWVSNSKTGTKLAYHASSLLITAAFTTKALFQSSPQPSLTSLTKKQTERRATLAFAACPHQYFTTV
uniref:Uncharacterized protein n=2 Tax=Oryza TaxID=4527 RepID=A0A0D9ZSD7_9ORYZ